MGRLSTCLQKCSSSKRKSCVICIFTFVAVFVGSFAASYFRERSRHNNERRITIYLVPASSPAENNQNQTRGLMAIEDFGTDEDCIFPLSAELRSTEIEETDPQLHGEQEKLALKMMGQSAVGKRSHKRDPALSLYSSQKKKQDISTDGQWRDKKRVVVCGQDLREMTDQPHKPTSQELKRHLGIRGGSS